MKKGKIDKFGVVFGLFYIIIYSNKFITLDKFDILAFLCFGKSQ